jgi:hypothetical protein
MLITCEYLCIHMLFNLFLQFKNLCTFFYPHHKNLHCCHTFGNLPNNSVALLHEVCKIYDLIVEVHFIIIHYLTMWPF